MEMEGGTFTARLRSRQDSSCHISVALGRKHVTCPRLSPCWSPAGKFSLYV